MASTEDELADLNDMRRELKRCRLQQRTIYILEEAGFVNILSLHNLDEASLGLIPNLKLAERLTLKKLIQNGWRGLGVPTQRRDQSVYVGTHQSEEHDETVSARISRTSRTHKSKRAATPLVQTTGSMGRPQSKPDANRESEVVIISNDHIEVPGAVDLRKQMRDDVTDDVIQDFSESDSSSVDDTKARLTKLQEQFQTTEDECNLVIRASLAKKKFHEGDYENAEDILKKLDKKSKSYEYRLLFGGNLTTRLEEFGTLHNRIDRSITDVSSMNGIAKNAFNELSLGYKELLEKLKMPHTTEPFVLWVEQLSEILNFGSDLKYGSPEWTQIMTKTTTLVELFSRPEEPAMKIINTSIMLMILHTLIRIWYLRNSLCRWDIHALMRIASYMLPLSEADIVSSVYFSKIRSTAYELMVLSLGCEISNARLNAKEFKPEFDKLKQTLDKIDAECLQLGIKRKDDDQEQLDKYVEEVERAYEGESNSGSAPVKSLKIVASKIIEHFHSRRYTSMRRAMEEAEGEYRQVDFRIIVGCHISSTFSDIVDFHNKANLETSTKRLHGTFCDMLQRLGDDCSKTLTKMKKFSSKGLEYWIECVLEYEGLKIGSERWKELLKKSKKAVPDMLPGVDEDGRCVLSMHVHLAVVLINKVWRVFNHLESSNKERLLKLASINVQLVNSDLLASKWFCELKYHVYEMKVLSLAACIGRGLVTTYSEYDENRRALERYRDECKALSIHVDDVDERNQLQHFHEVVESRRTGKNTTRPGEGDRLIGEGFEIGQIIHAAIRQYHSKKFDEMVVSLSQAIRLDQSSDILLAFAGNLSYTFNSCVNYSNNIPEKEGLKVVETATYCQLLILANDHNDMMLHIGQNSDASFHTLMEMLFQCVDLSPKTKAWDDLMNQSCRCVKYFESLPEAGKGLSKAYILLFVTTMHNFVAVRNRLFPSEHSRLLPYIQVCIPFCESILVNSDEWADMKASVYGTMLRALISSIGSNQILYYESLHTYHNRFMRLKGKAKTPSKLQEDDVQRAMRRLPDFSKNLLPKLLFALAILYYDAKRYKGMNYFLSELDNLENTPTDTWRLRLIVHVSSGLQRHLLYFNQISQENAESRLKRCCDVLKCIASIHQTTMHRFGKTSNILQRWVDTLFQVKNGKPNIEGIEYGSKDWSTLMKISEEVAAYINNLGEGGRLISQSYIHFIVELIVKLTAAWNNRTNRDHIRDLWFLLSSIKLFEALDTSIFSAQLKKTVYNLVSVHLSIKETIKGFTQILEECLRQVDICQNILSEAEKHQHGALNWFSYEHISEGEYEPSEEESYEEKKEQAIADPVINNDHIHVQGVGNLVIANSSNINVTFQQHKYIPL